MARLKDKLIAAFYFNLIFFVFLSKKQAKTFAGNSLL